MDTIINMLLAESNKGNPEAAYKAGKMMETYGWNPVTYQRQYKKSAEAGYPPAQRVLGILGINGYLLKEESTAGNLVYSLNPEEGIEWLRKAAENNDVQARFILGKCYQHGIGVKKDNRISEILLTVASDDISEDEAYKYSIMFELIVNSLKAENNDLVIRQALAG